MSQAAVWLEAFWCGILTPISIAKGTISADFQFLLDPHKVASSTASLSHLAAFGSGQDGRIRTPGSEVLYLTRCVTNESRSPCIVLHFPHSKTGLLVQVRQSQHSKTGERLSKPWHIQSLDYAGAGMKNKGALLLQAWKGFHNTLAYRKNEKGKAQNQNLQDTLILSKKHIIPCREVNYKLIIWLCTNTYEYINTCVWI